MRIQTGAWFYKRKCNFLSPLPSWRFGLMPTTLPSKFSPTGTLFTNRFAGAATQGYAVPSCRAPKWIEQIWKRLAFVGVRWRYFSCLCNRAGTKLALLWDINLLSVSFLSLLEQPEHRDCISAHNEQTGNPLCVCVRVHVSVHMCRSCDDVLV